MKTYQPVNVVIDPEHAARFARAIGADPGDGIAPTYAAVYALKATAPQLMGDPEMNINYAKLVHGEQEFEWTRHPKVGEELVATGTMTSDVERRGLRFVELVTDVKDKSGADVCKSRALFVIRS